MSDRETIQQVARQAAARVYNTHGGPYKIADAVAVALLQHQMAHIPGDDGREFIQSYLDWFSSPSPQRPLSWDDRCRCGHARRHHNGGLQCQGCECVQFAIAPSPQRQEGAPEVYSTAWFKRNHPNRPAPPVEPSAPSGKMQALADELSAPVTPEPPPLTPDAELLKEAEQYEPEAAREHIYPIRAKLIVRLAAALRASLDREREMRQALETIATGDWDQTYCTLTARDTLAAELQRLKEGQP